MFSGWRHLFRRGRDADPRKASSANPESAQNTDAENEALTEEALLASLRLQLADVDQVPVLSNLTYVRAFAPGLVEILAVCLPGAVVAPPAGELSKLGTPPELVARGRAQLADVLGEIGDTIEVRQFTSDDGLTFTGLLGESLSVASLAILLPQVVRLLHRDESTEKGVFFAVPNAHHLVLRVVDGMESLMAVGPMSVFARNGYEDAASTSPHVYWAHGPGLSEHTPLTTHDSDHIAIHVPSDLSTLLET
ncbi:MAG: hypothetical protein Q4G51_01910 [Dermatophilus congolensis]|nr:hypothetical protein [Dermatophilus congolensis]